MMYSHERISRQRRLKRWFSDIRSSETSSAIRRGQTPAYARRQHRRDVFGQASSQLLQHALLGHRSRDRLTLQCQVVVETGDDLLRGQRQIFESLVQIEQVTVPAQLQHCAQLRAEQLLGLEEGDLRRSAVPAVFHGERIPSNTKQARVLPGVDLDLQLDFSSTGYSVWWASRLMGALRKRVVYRAARSTAHAPLRLTGQQDREKRQSPDDYLRIMAGSEPVASRDPLLEDARRDLSVVAPETFAAVVQAMRKGIGLQLVYRSMNHPTGTDRLVFPHALVRVPRRWHMRA